MFTKLKNVLSKILRNHRHYNSALFIPGNKANENFAYINPCLDFDDRFSNIEKLQTNVSLRKLNINVNELQKVWDHYKYISSNKNNLEEKRVKITEQVNELLKKKNLVPEEEKRLTALKEQGKILKQDLKIIKEALWDLEENVITRALKLPNEIDENTPCENSIILKNVGAKTKFQGKCLSHLEIGKNLGLVDYKSPICYYLQNDAVDFELGIMNLSGKILNSNNCIRISGVDFSRSIIIEGCGMNHENPMESFILKNTENAEKYLELNKLHLTGGASLPAFLAMLAKQLIRPKYFPLRFFATGRQYIPVTDSNSSYGLFAANQASAVHAFFLTKNVDEYKLEFEKLVEIGLAIYKEIASHHRAVLIPASELKPWETMKVSFEMWSSYSEKYIEVGHVSAYSSYFSKRLLIAYQTPSGREFPYCISGTLVSVPKVLACLLEENPEKFLVPEKILKLAF